MSPEARERSFDDLARALAEGSISRRRALKLFAGTAIAALIPSRALAQQQKVTICHKPGTPDEETKEVSQSAVASHLRHGDQLGPCVICLPNGDTCMANDDCCSGNCVNSTCSACPSGTVELSNGTCAKPCTGLADCSGCGGCITDVSGARYCRDAEGARSFGCTTDNDCPTGQFCVEGAGSVPNSCTGVC